MGPSVRFTVGKSLCLLKSQLGIFETELRDLLCEREKKVEEIQESSKEREVSLFFFFVPNDKISTCTS